MAGKKEKKLVKDVMIRNVITLKPEDTISKAIEKMKKHKVSSLPVIGRDGKVIGILTETDILRALDVPDFPDELVSPPPFDFIEALLELKREELDVEKALEAWKTGLVKDIMTKEVITVNPNASIEDAATIMLEHGVRRLPVVNEEGKLVGLVSRFDLLKALI